MNADLHPQPPSRPPSAGPTFREALGVWVKIGLLSFGGPTGQIALMHQELVERRRWVDEPRFLHALNYCMLLPGPEAQQLSIYTGWLLHGARGGLVAGTLFVLPGALLLWAVSWLYLAHGDVPWLAAIFAGLKPAVTGIVAFAVLRIGRRALRTTALWVVAGAAFVAIFLGHVPFPAIIVGAALAGWLGGRWAPGHFRGSAGGHAPAGAAAAGGAAGRRMPDTPGGGNIPRASVGGSLRTTLLWLVVWATPVVAAAVALGPGHVLAQEGLFFSKAAVVTFGGAYAVLPYVAQQAVEQHGWLTSLQMLDGLGLAETTPGPLILVLEFVGFVGAWGQPAPFSPLVAGTLGAGMTVWTTFAPGFLFIFAGAPWVERVRGHQRLDATLTAITAAVVGVVLNLAVWFAAGVLWPQGGGFDWFAALVSVTVFAGLWRWKWDVVWVVPACGALGWLVHVLA